MAASTATKSKTWQLDLASKVYLFFTYIYKLIKCAGAGFPTIKVFPSDRAQKKKEPQDYQGPRTAAGIST